jgi:hypothetical protein
LPPYGRFAKKEYVEGQTVRVLIGQSLPNRMGAWAGSASGRAITETGAKDHHNQMIVMINGKAIGPLIQPPFFPCAQVSPFDYDDYDVLDREKHEIQEESSM